MYILIRVCYFFSNRFLPSIQPYFYLYRHLAYQLSIICAQFVNPLACFLTIWIMVANIKIINCLSLVCLITGCLHYVHSSIISCIPVAKINGQCRIDRPVLDQTGLANDAIISFVLISVVSRHITSILGTITKRLLYIMMARTIFMYKLETKISGQ